MPKLRHLHAMAPWGDHSADLTDPERNVEPFYTKARWLIETTPSCVYFIECGDYVKIGTTTKGAAWRMATMQLPPNAAIVAVIHGAGPVHEKELHRMFRAQRVGGEWFAHCPELDGLITAHAV